VRTYIRQRFAEIISGAFGDPDVIAGVATGGIANGALVAQDFGLPFVYVRTEPKGHGLENLVEGVVSSGQSVVVCEDLISTGGSSLKTVEALRAAGCVVKGMVAIFSYGFPAAEKAFAKAKCKLVTLSDYDHLLKQALQSGFVRKEDMDLLVAWRKGPDTWKG
jgi:orotate phosphoribosyltransferase